MRTLLESPSAALGAPNFSREPNSVPLSASSSVGTSEPICAMLSAMARCHVDTICSESCWMRNSEPSRVLSSSTFFLLDFSLLAQAMAAPRSSTVCSGVVRVVGCRKAPADECLESLKKVRIPPSSTVQDELQFFRIRFPLSIVLVLLSTPALSRLLSFSSRSPGDTGVPPGHGNNPLSWLELLLARWWSPPARTVSVPNCSWSPGGPYHRGDTVSSWCRWGGA